MDSPLSRIVSTISEYISALPGALSHMALEGAGEALVEFGPWLVIVLMWQHPLIAMGALTGMVLIFGATLILAETLSGEWNSRPRSLFSYEKETGSTTADFPSGLPD
jgi:hypothetical protein